MTLHANLETSPHVFYDNESYLFSHNLFAKLLITKAMICRYTWIYVWCKGISQRVVWKYLLNSSVADPSHLCAPREAQNAAFLKVMADVSSGNSVSKSHHVADGRPPVLTHPSPTATAIGVDGDVGCWVVAVVGWAAVRIGELEGAHDANKTKVPSYGEGLREIKTSPERLQLTVTAVASWQCMSTERSCGYSFKDRAIKSILICSAAYK